jgi:hypothetical protein
VKGQKEKHYVSKVVPITPYFRPQTEQQDEQKELPADLATVQRWLNYADVALKLPPAPLLKDRDKAA